MKKNLKVLGLLIILVIVFIIFVICFNSINSKRIIFSTTYYYNFGSEKIIIYEDGTVETDKEVEEPNHKTDFKKIKELTTEEINQLKVKLEENLSETDFKEYINELIHGDKNYDVVNDILLKINNLYY